MLKIEGRLPFYSREIQKFVKFLNRKYGVDALIKLSVMDQDGLTNDVLEEFGVEGEIPDKLNWFGLYIPELGHKLVAARIFWPRYATMILIIIAHEYYHALQHIREVEFDERQSDAWANRAVLSYIMEQSHYASKNRSI
jgi:hypothetical protein